MDTITLILLVYTLWAFYSGYKFWSGRSAWLDKRAPLSIACKLVLSVIVGYFIVILSNRD